MESWIDICQVGVSSSGLQELSSRASTHAFDDQSELLWVGNESGRITSFFGSELAKYTSYLGHPSSEGQVRQFLFHDKGVISVASGSVHLSSRTGFTLWHIADEKMKDLRCMSFMGKDNRQLLVAGCQNIMFKVDIEKGCIVETIPAAHEYTMMKLCKYICAATSGGTIDLIDTFNLQVVKVLETSTVQINDMDARNNYLVTCGWVNRAQGRQLSTLANVYDLRTMVQLNPVPAHAGAAFAQMHPKMSSTCILCSQHGNLQAVDLMNPASAMTLPAAVLMNFVSGLVVAPSGDAMAIIDGGQNVNLRGSSLPVRFTEYIKLPLVWGDTPQPLQPIDVDDTSMPLSSVGMPYYRERILSAWSSDTAYDVGNPPAVIDPNIRFETAVRNTRRQHEFGDWAPNPKNVRRNQVEKPRVTESNGAAIAAPKFLSEKARVSENERAVESQIHDLEQSLMSAALRGSTKSEVPVIYRNVEIKYSRFGVDDFDFSYYNKTQYSGLETHIANSYTNPLLQLLRFTPVMRNLALHHTASDCMIDPCLLCELGFLFDTLEKAEGCSCQATNLLKTFSNIPHAKRLSLLEETSQVGPASQAHPLTDMIQGACRLFLSQSAEDCRRVPANYSAFNQSMSIDAMANIRCPGCHNTTTRDGRAYITDLTYPIINQSQRFRQRTPTFSEILRASIETQSHTRGWCDKCRRYHLLATSKFVRSVPDVLTINAALKSNEIRQYWSIAGWLPDSIGVLVENGKFTCFEGEDLRLHLQKGMHVIKVYDLVGFVADINSKEHQKPHMVSLINVALSSRAPRADESGSASDWHLFNDFLVQSVSKEEALRFASSWKMPSVITFQAASQRNSVDDSWKSKLNTDILYNDWSINNRPHENCQALRVESEAPGAGSYVAIDTEFVTLQQEEIEMKADGQREVVRPTRLGLARVSVLRGQGEDEGVPFINEYITIREDIVDHLTKFSGVQPGDLDPVSSPHSLVPLKIAYKKLWLLLNLGCIFIGHGLPKDFRTINIHVPKSQVVDTVDLFYLRSRQRKLSLRYLAWYLLKEDIQQDNHDSIEDARTALRLWHKFEEFQDAGIAESMIEEVYREGKKWGWKPPGESLPVAGRRADMISSESGGLAVPGAGDGRETPEILQGLSGPGTPSGRRGMGRSSEYMESPLR